MLEDLSATMSEPTTLNYGYSKPFHGWRHDWAGFCSSFQGSFIIVDC